MRNSVRRMSAALNFGFDRWTPDSFVLAIVLTVVVFLAGVFFAGQSPIAMANHWGKGFWTMLVFSMQMALLVAGGLTLGTAPPAKRFLQSVARIPKTPVSAVIVMVVAGAGLSYFHWAIGSVAGAIMAKEIAVQLKKVDFKILVASNYAASIGGIGLGGTEWLMVNTPGHFLEKKIGIIPFSETLYHPAVWVTMIISITLLCVYFWAVHPDEKDVPDVDPALKAKFVAQAQAAEAASRIDKASMTPAERMENSPVCNLIVVGLVAAYIGYTVSIGKFKLSVDMFNLIMLTLGFLLHWTPKSLITSFEDGSKAANGILLQFPFYAGMQGMLVGAGMVPVIAQWFVDISTPATFQIWNYLSGAFVNLFIPSSAGIFVVQGPIMVEAGARLGLPANETIIAFTAGEVISNKIQPFWAIPLLGMVGLKMKDIIGYCLISFLIFTVVFLLGFQIFFG